MESGTRDGRVALNHSLDSLFEGKSMILKHKPKKRKESDNSEEESGSEEPDDPHYSLSFVLATLS